MFSVPVNVNTIYIPMIQTGCFKAEYDSAYPIHLNGIISQHEFLESINKINQTFFSYKNLLIACSIVLSLTIIFGTASFTVGGIMAARSLTIFYILLGLGILLTTIGPLFFTIGFCLIYTKRTARLRQAIAEESMKYSSRSPTPCSWRLETPRTWFGGYSYYNNYQMFYQLAIDIGCSVPQENMNRMHGSTRVAPESTSFFRQEDNYAPPPYSTQTATFCSQCGLARQDITAKFCSSCGHSFNQY
ncbi:unnamed protein product [Rotaria sp. Silwood1]|nr:unnamed protein product [Rotaria sp. Silwood1]CAF3626849.1 unnamed protein product [Rotaria sp. Silwood1]CAF3665090.1 unnamed protein product [Rotaria sp. Silwood1]CAF4774347.1 unnamed protein product [Rotaria sp. Silwood1]CAF5017094.1 unnamed protein product [Rotaria sp. Silwood1]